MSTKYARPGHEMETMLEVFEETSERNALQRERKDLL